MLRNEVFAAPKRARYGIELQIAPEWGREEAEMAEKRDIERTILIVEGYLEIFPTQHLQVLGRELAHREGASLPDIRVYMSMDAPESREPIGVSVVFLGMTGSPQEIIYSARTINSMKLTRRPRDGWQLVEYIYTGLPLKSQR